MNIKAIKQQIEAGYISEREHPSAPLRILNYTPRAQYDWHWTPETMQCRGLIVDDKWSVVARPFEKFFSAEQLNGNIPNEPFDVYEKLDGSLGILYFTSDGPAIATRGSFTSKQAQWATNALRTKYASAAADLDPSFTYLFEIIYPDNRIVVNYFGAEELVLLAVIETATGKEFPLEDIGFTVAKQYDGLDNFDELVAMDASNREGFVVRFRNSGQRVKVKFDQYRQLHKKLTGTRERSIWEVLSASGDMADVIENTPDEFHQWVRETESSLRSEFGRIESAAKSAMRFGGNRRELAEYFNLCEYPGVMFAMLDGKPYANQIWNILKPSGDRRFACGVGD